MHHFPTSFRESRRPRSLRAVRLAARDYPGFISRMRSPVIPSQNIHSFGRGEFACAAEAVALCIIAPGTGHRRREP
jgi:hypothetical protein